MGTTASPAFSLQVAVLSQPAGVDSTRTIERSRYTVQQVHTAGGRVANALLMGPPSVSTGSIKCADADFTTGDAEITLGKYTLISNVEYATGTAAQTATALAASISRLPEFTGTVDGGDNTKVNVTGPMGPVGGTVVLKTVYTGTVTNYTLVPTTGTLAVGGPYVGPPTF